MLSTRKTGTQIINNAVTSFEKVTADIERGIALNDATIASNTKKIEELVTENASLANANGRGSRIISRIRELLA